MYVMNRNINRKKRVEITDGHKYEVIKRRILSTDMDTRRRRQTHRLTREYHDSQMTRKCMIRYEEECVLMCFLKNIMKNWMSFNIRACQS